MKESKGAGKIQRRDLFRMAGAGTIVAAAERLGALELKPSADLLESASSSAWREATSVDADREQAWQQRMNWWRDAKFGLFIHWNPSSVASVEISWPIMRPNPKWHITEEEYVNLYKRFDPSKFNPDSWVELAEAAGQKYVVFTTKHHDGFCMFDSSFTNYKITNTPYKKDILRMLADACSRRSMPLGYYYSPPDMHHPDFRDTSKPARENWEGEPARPQWPIYLQYMQLQLRELVTRYGEPALFFFDGLDQQEKYDGYYIERMLRELSPSSLINNRLGTPGDYETPEQFVPARIPVKGYRIVGVNPELGSELPGGIPRPEEFRPWETCMTMNDTWGYNKNDRKFKSTKTIIRALVDVASKGGNLLLNVGPTDEGLIQPEFADRLRDVGRWLQVNGESIYGTTYGPVQGLSYGRTTAKQGVVYLHVFDSPGGEVSVAGMAPVRRVELLADGQVLRHRQSGNTLAIQLPPNLPDTIDSVVKIELH